MLIIVHIIVFAVKNGRVASIKKLQQLIEHAWQIGFDRQGAEQLGWKLVDTKKWIGATEIVALLSSLKLKWVKKISTVYYYTLCGKLNSLWKTLKRFGIFKNYFIWLKKIWFSWLSEHKVMVKFSIMLTGYKLRISRNFAKLICWNILWDPINNFRKFGNHNSSHFWIRRF